MPFKTFANGNILTDGDLNDYLMEQAVISCTSGTRPASPNAGMMLYETDTDRYVRRNGANSAWEYWGGSRVLYTPTLGATTTPPTLGSGSSAQGWYVYLPGPSVHFVFVIRFGTSGAAAGSGSYTVTLPVTSAIPLGSAVHSAVGSLMLADASSSGFQVGSTFNPGTSTSILQMISGNAPITNAAPWVWANSDYLSGSITYPV